MCVRRSNHVELLLLKKSFLFSFLSPGKKKKKKKKTKLTTLTQRRAKKDGDCIPKHARNKKLSHKNLER